MAKDKLLNNLRSSIALYTNEPDYILNREDLEHNMLTGIWSIAGEIDSLRNKVNALTIINKDIPIVEEIKKDLTIVEGCNDLLHLMYERFRDNKFYYRDVQENDHLKCTRDCPICIDHWNTNNYQGKNIDTLNFCLNQCTWCIQYRKTLKQTYKLKEEKEMKITLNVMDTNVRHPNMINSNDKYFEVLLTSESSDGSYSYISNCLIRNFKKMFPNSYSAKSWIYSINQGINGSPELNGLIRYDHKNKYKITPKCSHIKNIVVAETSKAKNSRPFMMNKLTHYHNKQYNTSKDSIITIYHKIVKNELNEGCTLEDFLASD